MSIPTEEGDQDPAYSVKTVSIHHSPTEMGLMMVKFNGENNKPLSKEGFRGDYVIYMALAGGLRFGTYDPYALGREVNFELMEDFALAVRRGVKGHQGEVVHWSDIEDGETIDHDRFGELLEVKR